MDRPLYIVVAEPLAVGGPENAAPTVTPMPAPVGLEPAPPDPAFQPGGRFDLTGVGAMLSVVDDWLGNAPDRFEIDALGRKQMESRLRDREANPQFLSSCAIGMGVQKYQIGQPFLVIAVPWEGHADLATLYRFRISDGTLVLDPDVAGYDRVLMVSADSQAKYFPDATHEDAGMLDDGTRMVYLTRSSVPMEQMRAFVQGVFLGVSPAATPLPQGASRISPPDTGDAGLR